MKFPILISVSISIGLLFYAAPTRVGASSNMCTAESCKVGATAVTYATKNEPYYRCTTRDIAEYVTFVIGLIAIDAQFGTPPNISDKTGEPELKGESKLLLDNLRNKAEVLSFDEALASCAAGKNGRKVTILNIPEDMAVAYVQDLKAGTTFWMPLSSLNKLR